MYRESPLSFTVATGGVESARLVKLSSGEITHNTETSTDDPIGVTTYAATAGEQAVVNSLSTGGTLEMTAAGAVTSGNDVYAAADGKIQELPGDTGDYRKIGIALQDASGDNSKIEVLPYNYHHVESVD